MTETRVYKWDNLKVIMILGIVLEHAILIYGYPRSLELFWGLFISWLMPMFTIISGCWMKERPLVDLCNRYLYPMLLFSGVNFMVGYFFNPSYHSGFHAMGYAMWYLWALFVYSFITPKLMSILTLKRLLLLSCLMVMVYNFLPLSGSILTLTNECQLNRIIGFYPFYLFGIMLKNMKLVGGESPLLYLILSIVIYLVLCWSIEGLAYSSGFYLAPHMSLYRIFCFVISYLFIGLICYFIIRVTPNKKFVWSAYGGRTMNVYMLHMLLVFPISYGIFSQLPHTLLWLVLNVILVPLMSMFFLGDKIDKVMNFILTKRSWGLAIAVYLVAIVLVNKSWLLELI